MITYETRDSRRAFFTPEWFAQEQAQRRESSRGKLLLAGCCSGAYLSTQVVEKYNQFLAEAGSQDTVSYLPKVDFQFSDTENRPISGVAVCFGEMFIGDAQPDH